MTSKMLRLMVFLAAIALFTAPPAFVQAEDTAALAHINVAKS